MSVEKRFRTPTPIPQGDRDRTRRPPPRVTFHDNRGQPQSKKGSSWYKYKAAQDSETEAENDDEPVTELPPSSPYVWVSIPIPYQVGYLIFPFRWLYGIIATMLSVTWTIIVFITSPFYAVIVSITNLFSKINTASIIFCLMLGAAFWAGSRWPLSPPHRIPQSLTPQSDDQLKLGDITDNIVKASRELRASENNFASLITKAEEYYQQISRAHQGQLDKMEATVLNGFSIPYREQLHSTELNSKVKGAMGELRSVLDVARVAFEDFSARYEATGIRLKTLESRVEGVEEQVKTVAEHEGMGEGIPTLVERLVEDVIFKEHADKADFALYSAGAQVMASLTSPTKEIWPEGLPALVYGVATNQGYALGRPPTTALDPDSHAGNCWPFAGARGSLGVILAKRIYVEEISVDHVSQLAAVHAMSSAPKEMEVWGRVEGPANSDKVKGWMESGADLNIEKPDILGAEPYVRLTNFTYDITLGRDSQAWLVDTDIASLGIDFGVVVLVVKSNWGADYTCMYRFRVHGRKVDA